eukprot:scaffold125596_cov60-Phaeocystis_antarctica.AAC.1
MAQAVRRSPRSYGGVSCHGPPPAARCTDRCRGANQAAPRNPSTAATVTVRLCHPYHPAFGTAARRA